MQTSDDNLLAGFLVHRDSLQAGHLGAHGVGRDDPQGLINVLEILQPVES